MGKTKDLVLVVMVTIPSWFWLGWPTGICVLITGLFLIKYIDLWG